MFVQDTFPCHTPGVAEHSPGPSLPRGSRHSMSDPHACTGSTQRALGMERTWHQACSNPNARSEYLQPQGSPFPTVTQQVCPDVACLSMYSENAAEAGAKGGHGRPVSMQEVIVVFEPVGQDIVWDHTPASFPHLQRTREIRAAQSPKSMGNSPALGCSSVRGSLASSTSGALWDAISRLPTSCPLLSQGVIPSCPRE